MRTFFGVSKSPTKADPRFIPPFPPPFTGEGEGEWIDCDSKPALSPALSRKRERENCFTRLRVPLRKSAGIVLILGLGVVSAGAQVRLQASVEPREATVGDRVELKITAVPDAGVTLQPFISEKQLGPFEVVGFSTGVSATAGVSSPEFRWTLTIFDVGVSTIPPIAFRYRGRDGKEKTAATPALPVTVRSVLKPDAKDIHGLKGKLSKVLDKAALGILLAALAAVGLAVLFLRRKRAAAPAPPGPPPRPAHETALEALSRLEESLTDPAKVYYSRLADILRAYLEGRFQIPSLDRTTGEITAALKAGPFPVDQRMALREVLDNSDFAKFAKGDPEVNERLKDLERVRGFVQDTRPAPAPDVRAVSS